MVYMLEKTFFNDELNIELTSFIDNKQNIWFKGKDVAKILGYADTRDVIRKHVSEEHKIKQLSRQPGVSPGWSQTYFIDEAGFYELTFSNQNYQLQKNSAIGYSLMYSHP